MWNKSEHADGEQWERKEVNTRALTRKDKMKI